MAEQMVLPVAGRELVERVRGLLPLLAEQAAEAERLRQPTDTCIRALEASGVFRLMVPRCYGGLELDLDTFLEVGLLLGEADTSMAWVTTFCVEHNWMLCQFPESFQRELYRERSHVLAPGAIAPSGRVRREAGGFRLTGRWQWGTGVMHASWVIVGAAPDGGDLGDLRFFALPIEEVKVEDTWYVDGMVGTGSNDIVIDDVLVPEERSVPIAAMVSGQAHGASLHGSPLYGTPMIPILMLAASMPIIGQARAVVRGFRQRLEEHVRLGSTRQQAEKPASQMRLARAHLEQYQAERLLRDVVAEVLERRGAASIEERVRWSTWVTHAVHQARRVVQDVSEASGASAHFLDHSLQRALRDVNVASCHVAFDVDARLELYGRQLLGLEPTTALF